ncbi:hypothetical protein C8R44DRAFT_852934 [Mycena epipterygia]|nr:hypothetical protein C8R44DRAFT_852934 [Mycena epipterygia]
MDSPPAVELSSFTGAPLTELLEGSLQHAAHAAGRLRAELDRLTRDSDECRETVVQQRSEIEKLTGELSRERFTLANQQFTLAQERKCFQAQLRMKEEELDTEQRAHKVTDEARRKALRNLWDAEDDFDRSDAARKRAEEACETARKMGSSAEWAQRTAEEARRTQSDDWTLAEKARDVAYEGQREANEGRKRAEETLNITEGQLREAQDARKQAEDELRLGAEKLREREEALRAEEEETMQDTAQRHPLRRSYDAGPAVAEDIILNEPSSKRPRLNASEEFDCPTDLPEQSASPGAIVPDLAFPTFPTPPIIKSETSTLCPDRLLAYPSNAMEKFNVQ